ncbi:hypothetical protein ABB37_06681 [Leptomonas pyrrhocoris]|uniref:Core domain-containing protein n=1 Tax=Leptomonas pyrrhocoris TaxID=157538 RepID=A0A0N0DTS1_LEPPY|nr:hypothetical protein ABB37_06681 [Leptomonas pyrrhocoris]KPA77892.1 hypothetical protein ABB37_06681 [Leptomonas pyrrhocoris]|eukprot:XP_015656331.1 hypothetical protein ABB37_06681 [Leptomonas pyrrhocoris]
MQRRFFSAASARVSAALRNVTVGSLLAPQRFQSTAAVDTQVGSVEVKRTDAGAPSYPGSSSNNGSSHRQSLYKSSHKGTGSTPMPKPYQARKEKPNRAPAGAAVVDPAPAPLFGARSSCAEDAGPVPQRALSPLQKRQLQFRNKAAFVLTPQALRRVKFLIGQYPSTHVAAKGAATSEEGAGGVTVPCGIRIGVRRRGCSGYSYTVNYFFAPASGGQSGSAAAAGAAASPAGKKGSFMDDVVVEQDGVKVVVDGDALFYVIGTEMDYVVRNVEEKFTFKNPNQKYGCGCEESFMPFDEDDLDDD